MARTDAGRRRREVNLFWREFVDFLLVVVIVVLVICSVGVLQWPHP